MNIAIVGAGNMGSAIVAGLMNLKKDNLTVLVSNPSSQKLDAIKLQFPSVQTTGNNIDCVKNADIIVLAVKPYVLPLVAEEIKPLLKQKVIISVVAGVVIDQLIEIFGDNNEYFYVIPNTAISTGHGMTFVTSKNTTERSNQFVKEIFDTMGTTAFIEERLMGAATALSSCGIAYAFKYIQACVQAGVELGFKPSDAQKYAVATVSGAMSLLEKVDTTPQLEIDKVTTPGGMTIKGINKLEETGFVSSIIASIKEPLKK